MRDICLSETSLSREQSCPLYFITGPPNGPVLFCSLEYIVCRVVGRPTLHGGLNGPVVFCLLSSVVGRSCLLASSVVVRNAAGRVGGRPLSGRPPGACRSGQYCYVPLRRHLVLFCVLKDRIVWLTMSTVSV